MAEKTLKSIQFPGLEGRYTVPEGGGGATGPAGKDGITPTIGANGNWYLGDTDTQKPSRGEKGADGAAGKDGSDGYSPEATVTPINGGAKIIIKDRNGTTSANVMNGAQGPKGDSYTLTTADKSEIAEAVVAGGVQAELGDEPVSLGISGATPGQIAKITAVDETGKPTAWEPVDMAGGGETWEFINEVTLSEDAMAVVFDKDKSGAAFALRKFVIVGTTKGSNASNTGGGVICINVANNPDDRYSIVPPISGHAALKGDTLRYWHAAAEILAEKGWRWYITGADNTWKTTNATIGTSLMRVASTIPKVATYLALWSRTSGSAFAAGSKIELYGVRA